MQKKLIKFAIDCASSEMNSWTYLEGPSDDWNEGMWQTFLEEFPVHTDADSNLVSRVYKETIRMLCDREGVEL